MTRTIELPDDLAARIDSPEDVEFAIQTLRVAFHGTDAGETRVDQQLIAKRRAALKGLREFAKEMAGPDARPLPESAFARASFYEE